MKLRLIGLLSIYFCKSFAFIPYQMTTVYIDRQDGSTCILNDFRTIRGLSGYIISHDSSLASYRPGQQCFLVIDVPENYQVTIEAMEFDLGYPPGAEKCPSDSLFVFDNKPENGIIFESNLDMLGEYCGKKNGRSSRASTILATSSNNSITLYWHAAELAMRHPGAKGFKLKWFAIRRPAKSHHFLDGDRERRSACDTTNDFVCPNGQACIPLPLACDAQLYCSGGLDLIRKSQLAVGCKAMDDDPAPSDHNGLIIAGVLASLVASVLLTIFLSSRWRRFSQRKPVVQKSGQKPTAQPRGPTAAQRALLPAGATQSLVGPALTTRGPNQTTAHGPNLPTHLPNQAPTGLNRAAHGPVCCCTGGGGSADSGPTKTTRPAQQPSYNNGAPQRYREAPVLSGPCGSNGPHAVNATATHGSSTSADSSTPPAGHHRQNVPPGPQSQSRRPVQHYHYDHTNDATAPPPDDYYDEEGGGGGGGPAPPGDTFYCSDNRRHHLQYAYPSGAESYCSVPGYVRATVTQDIV